MTLLIIGSIAYDTVETKSGLSKDSLGGSATYCSLSASFFSPVRIVGVVGSDFKKNDHDLLQINEIDTTGLEVADGDTFRWRGRYDPDDFNKRDTLDTRLNVFAKFNPILSDRNRTSKFLFLGNIDPTLQLNVLEQMENSPTLVGLDTMNYWIDTEKRPLEKVVRKIDVLFMDEFEIREFTQQNTIYDAAEYAHDMGPSIVVIKKGEHGIVLSHEGNLFAMPAFPTRNVVDPTGAGDSFAGGFMGYLSSVGTIDAKSVRQAAGFASVMGSIAVENFSVRKLIEIDRNEINSRFDHLYKLTIFNPDIR
tara:strand:- start:5096 stop:6016 length:921 start_codon:yes stop_codon:yes gene_type:complete